ncbi:MAG: V-type synthase subunit [Evtepia sp.]|nr:V-type synthase subunit [Evtepia sp.]
MAKLKDTDFLFISTRVRALEVNLLNHERMERMLEAHSSDEALQVLADCDYPEIEDLDINSINAALAQEQQKTYDDLYNFVPNKAIIDVFKVKYDYHNAKVLLKAEAMQSDPAPLLLDLGRVPVRELTSKLNSSDLSGIPTILQSAIVLARETLGTTRDPQLSDFVLDQAYFQDMFLLAKKAESAFLAGYVRISIDAANLRTVVRTMRMGKSTEFMQSILFAGGNIDPKRVLNAAGGGGSLADLFATSPLREAAEAGMELLSDSPLTQFEKLCDNAVIDYLRSAKFVPFGEAPIIAYMAAKESELTAVRILLTGRMAKLPTDIIRERLRDAYV